MTVSKDDAGRALEIIGNAGTRTLTLKRYSRVAPLLFACGSVWFIANAVIELVPDWSDVVRLGGGICGVSMRVLLGLGPVRRRSLQV
jgi:hypothetical protein